MPENSTLDVLKSALLLEKKGKAFYQNIANKSDTSSVKEFFSFMASEEDKHIEMLSQQFKSYQTNGTFVSNNTSENHTDVELSVISKDIKEPRQITMLLFIILYIQKIIPMESGQ